ncbi:MAG: hypothetical protein C4560_05055 [Nitrospiraceae bacterium]|nr:MAG: hypothetical protein C4560_05055 [Nitrospiraceae bacterium]
MAKEIYNKGYDFFFWEYEPQTKIKHFVFKEYFDKWVKIAGKQENIDEVPYLETDIKNAIKALKSDGSVKTIPVDSKTERGLQGKDVIIFH